MPTDNVTALRKQGGRKPGTKNKCSNETISHALRIDILASLNYLGRHKYLIQLAKKSPRDYALLLSKCIEPDEKLPTGITIVIQAAPVPQGAIAGVVNSPIKSHLGAPQPRRIANGEVVDAEPRK